MNINNAIRQAFEYYQIGNWEQAANIYLEILKLQPTNLDAAHFLGLIYYVHGNYKKAVEYFTKVAKANPSFIDEYNKLGIKFQNDGTLISSTFEQNLANFMEPVAEDISSSNIPLLIAFGGLSGALAMLPFEFFNLCKEMRTNKLFIRDQYQACYQFGLPKIARDIDDITRYLKTKIQLSNSNRTVLVGNSMGGYAAILFGLLLNADIVHAFSPQTFIDKLNRAHYSDTRWEEQLNKVLHHPARKEEYFNLKDIFKSGKHIDCTFHLYFSKQNRIDNIHSQRLEGFPNVFLHPVDDEDHAVVKKMRDSGLLKKIIMDSLFC